MRLLAPLTLIALLPLTARADIDVKDAAGDTQTYNTSTDGDGDHTGQFVITDGAGTRQGTSSAPLRVDVTGGTTQPVSAASLPLPTGAATQATLASMLAEIESLLASIDAINAKLAALGQTTMAGSVPVTLASNQSAVTVTDGSGSMTVDGTVTVGSISSSVTPGNGSGNLGKAEGAAHNSADTGVFALAVRDDAVSADCADGTYCAAKVNSSGRLYTAATIDAALPAGTNAIGTVTAVGGAANGTAASGNPVLQAGYDGTNARTVRTDSSGRVVVVGAASSGSALTGNPVLIAGSDSSTAVNIAVDSSGRVLVIGQAAHDAPTANLNPVSVAGTASAAAPSNVSADGDAVNLWALRNGAQVVQLSAAGALIGGDATNGADVDVTRVATPATVYATQTTVATAGTEVTLGSSQALTQGCHIKAKATNTGFIYVGLNGVTSSTGYALAAGETVFVPIDNRATIFIDSSVNAEGTGNLCF